MIGAVMKVVKAGQSRAGEWSRSNLFSLQVIMDRDWPEMAPHTHIATTPSDPDQENMSRIRMRTAHMLKKSLSSLT